MPAHLPLKTFRCFAAAAALAAACLASALPGAAHAGPPPPFAARWGLELATAAAWSWSADAALVYVENDEPVDDYGAAPRWGYLFRSESRGATRAYSVRDGAIVVAEDLDMKFDAPPLPSQWLDSAQVFAIAERAGGRDFCVRHRGRLATMLLVRGAFSDDDPDATRWAVVYSAPGVPSLFVLVDAADGRVHRTWRG